MAIRLEAFVNYLRDRHHKAHLISFSRMGDTDPELYRTLAQSSFVLFKGDLNYRKLIGDLAWPPTSSFERALQGFNPAPLATLRTLVSTITEVKHLDINQ